MKQFGKILRFELMGYLKNKVFVGITVLLVVVIAVAMFIPNIVAAVGSDDDGERPVMLLGVGDPELGAMLGSYFTAAFPDSEVVVSDESSEDIIASVAGGEAECAFVFDSPTSYTYYVNDRSIYDANTAAADALLREAYSVLSLGAMGLTPEQIDGILNAQIDGRTEILGADQTRNYFYTYIMLLALYMAILLYGQMVATNVATEKSSRAMELLVTSAKPSSMMFGKVLASCIAGLGQLVAIFGSALVLYNVNKSAWSGNTIMQSMFNIPLDLFAYMLVFFVLGFLIYAFLYGAIGSTASKLEDINTSVMPITFLFIIAFFIVMFSISSSNVNNVAMRVCSYIPFTSPMAMFARIAMTTVPAYEIAISIILLVGSAVGIGVLAARIYRVGVLLYGSKLRLRAALRLVFTPNPRNKK